MELDLSSFQNSWIGDLVTESLRNLLIERTQSVVTFETFDQSDEESLRILTMFGNIWQSLAFFGVQASLRPVVSLSNQIQIAKITTELVKMR